MYRRWICPFEEPRRMQEWINRAFGEFEPIAPGRRLPAGTREEIAETATLSILSQCHGEPKSYARAGAITIMHD